MVSLSDLQDPEPTPPAGGYLSSYLAHSLLDMVLGGVAWTPPGSVWVGLSCGPANAVGLVSEPRPDFGYRRVKVPNDLIRWPSAGLRGGAKSNGQPVRFPRPVGSWGLVRSLFLADGPGGPGVHVLFMVNLVTARRVEADGPAVVLGPGALRVRWG